ncbi:hypothetical protein [Variovorax sp. KK3]|uniref:hypothetical protein n=1 Tax=Variovorax sp. KK3 TaxID=1855728 RepID=UPI002118321A|nr:hypothetical protein [Variovorax sp. KK3]
MIARISIELTPWNAAASSTQGTAIGTSPARRFAAVGEEACSACALHANSNAAAKAPTKVAPEVLEDEFIFWIEVKAAKVGSSQQMSRRKGVL